MKEAMEKLATDYTKVLVIAEKLDAIVRMQAKALQESIDVIDTLLPIVEAGFERRQDEYNEYKANLLKRGGVQAVDKA